MNPSTSVHISSTSASSAAAMVAAVRSDPPRPRLVVSCVSRSRAMKPGTTYTGVTGVRGWKSGSKASLISWCGADKVAGVHPGAVLDDGGHDVRAQSLAIADDGVLRLLAQVVNQVHTVVDAPQLFEELVHIVKQIDALFGVGDDRVDHLMMACDHRVEIVFPPFVTLEGNLGGRYQLVGDAV